MRPVADKSERCVAGAQRDLLDSSDLAHVDEIVGEDPSGLGEEDRPVPIVRDRLDEIEVRGHASNADRPAEIPPDALFENRAPPLGDVGTVLTKIFLEPGRLLDGTAVAD